ncbi:MAG: EAL domain-containing response regulator [Myxococcaceae bacterium]|nr:EAL domain-containing response regulator [Myxococcaceae bacterium]MBH2006539.1 EAL domain-containing response regulator [Myxococcaceae bacterium]
MNHEFQRIVIVVDDPVAKDKIVQTMKQDQMEVVTCDEPEAVEALLSQKPIRILVVDVPRGFNLAHHVAAYYPETILVGVGISCDEVQLRRAERAGIQILLNELNWEAPESQCTTGSVQHFEKLEQFLAKDDVTASLQPIVSLSNPKPYTLGFESLARSPRALPLWNAETLFTYAAKKEHLLETDLFCIRAALREACHVPQLNKLFINLRPRSVNHPAFISKLHALLERTNFSASQIVFELTEQQSILNLSTFLENLKRIKKLGFEIALDDFGTGFANLEWLYDLQPSYLKIAGLFCRNIETDTTKQILLAATTEIAQKLQIKTVLENIETKRERDMAEKLGINFGQGYFFCKPTSARSILESNWHSQYPW